MSTTAIVIAVFSDFTCVSSGTTATILKLVGFLIGGLFTVCLGTFLCYKCLKTDDEDEETTYTVETECHPTTNERETTIY